MPGEPEQVLLQAILCIDENAYGVPIRDEVLRCTGRNLRLGMICETLGRMTENGLVTARTGAPTPGRGGQSRSGRASSACGSRSAPRRPTS